MVFGGLLVAAQAWPAPASADVSLSGAPGKQPFVIVKDGAWCWFQDERAVLVNNTLYVGSAVSSGWHNGAAHQGNIDVTDFDLVNQAKGRTAVLHANLELDDHDAPALWVRPDGRLVAAYAKHGRENAFYFRISDESRSRWEPERTWTDTHNNRSRLTYANLVFLQGENKPRGRLYNFMRGLEGELKPGYVFSDDAGESWTRGGVFIDVPNYSGMHHRPYVKYATDGQTRVHFLFTEGHPRNHNNSIHHLMYEDGYLLSTNGTRIAPLSTGIHDPASTASLVFHGDGDHVAWTSDLHLDKLGRPVGVFSVRRRKMGAKQGSADRAPTKQGTVADDAGTDIRYHYARWNGTTWSQHYIAHGGSGLYAKEADYSGNIALDPQDVDTVYFSTNVHPVSGVRLCSAADGRQHYEIFRGRTTDGGVGWVFEAVTADSSVDNIRPVVPVSPTDRGDLILWMRGQYRAYTDYETEIVGLSAS